MSNYKRYTKHPEYGTWEEAQWIDNHFGEHNYGVIFPSHPNVVFDPRDQPMETEDEFEVWKDIKGYEGLYLVSSLGRIKSLPRRNVKTENILKSYLNGGKRMEVRLSKKGKKVTFFVHRLVADTFLKNPNRFNMLDHINGNVKDNNVKNLRWCTPSQNQMNMRTRKTKMYSQYKGVHFRKQNNKYIASIKYDRKSYYLGSFGTEREAAEAYNKKAFELFKEFCSPNIFLETRDADVSKTIEIVDSPRDFETVGEAVRHEVVTELLSKVNAHGKRMWTTEQVLEEINKYERNRII
jgi:hypothetical protein